MKAEDLAKLGQNAKAFAKAYVQLKEELIRQGVEAEEAKVVARSAAMMTIFNPDEEKPWDT